MNLIITSPLVDTPPSDTLAIRYITSVAKCDMHMSVLIEMEQEVKDFYYPYMKKLGMMDFVDQYITPEENEDGIRLDTQNNYPRTLVLSRIQFENTQKIVDNIRYISSI